MIPQPTTAVVLAGGRGSRLGGLEKGEILLEGRRLIDIVTGAAVAVGCEQVIIAGAVTAQGATNVREEPPFGGPVAGLAAAIPDVATDWVMLLACDLPHAGLLCHLLAESFHHVDDEIDGLLALRDSRVQWLAGVYRTSSIKVALDRIEDPAGVSMRDLFGKMNLREVQDPEGLSRDIDTPEELEATKRGRSAT